MSCEQGKIEQMDHILQRLDVLDDQLDNLYFNLKVDVGGEIEFTRDWIDEIDWVMYFKIW